MVIQAIQTMYAGHLFRSRLEARWAAMFDQLDWPWTYEPFDTGNYIPDFLIHGDWPLLVEIKPAIAPADYEDVAHDLDKRLAGSWKGDVLILGTGPCMPAAWEGRHWDDPTAGYLGERYTPDDPPSDGWQWDAGLWNTCGKCGRITVRHSLMAFASRPCGHWEGDHYLNPVDPNKLRAHWGIAHSKTRWMPRA